ncbi:MAG TPA: hypothetical protein PK995_02020 [Bacteroidia bacterium]|nr:hypothetical protein [Bacteroidia bacterium]
MTYRQILEQLKSLSLETLSDAELQELKDELVKLLVDVQIQKDINAQLNKKHSTTDDIQMEVIQKVSNEEEEKSIHTIEEKTQKEEEIVIIEEKTQSNQWIVEEEISEEILNIYKEEPSKAAEENQNISQEKQENKKVVSQRNNISIPKISFSINDKFRIIKKLFKNNSEQFEKFIEQMNSANSLSSSEQIIQEFAKKNNWDEDTFEYQLLFKQNQKRFR